MKYLLCIVISILALTVVSVAEPVGDQEVHGATEVNVTPRSAGDRTLIETGGTPYIESSIPFNAECDVTSNMRVPGIIQLERPGTGTNPDWGSDIMVIDDTLASDPHLLRTESGDLYVVYKYMGPLISTNSSVTICRSTDNGLSWSWILDASVDDTTEIYNLDVVMEDEADSTFIFAMCNAQGDDIWLLRYNITAGTTEWVEVTFGYVFDPALDQLESTTSHYMYMTYCVYDTILRFRASSDWGATWTSSYGVHSGDIVHNPDIRILAANEIWAYIVWDNGPVTYSKGNDWQGFDGWAGITPHTHNFRGLSDDVNGQITGFYDSDTVWVVAEENYNNSGDWNIVWDYSYDGINWRNDTMFPDIDLANDPARDEKYFKALVGANAPNQARVVYNTQTTMADTRVDYQFCQYGGWSATTNLSDHLSKVGTAPSVNDLTAAGGGMIAYCGYDAIWFDYYWNTAVQEIPIEQPQIRNLMLSPTITREIARLSFTIRTPGFVTVSLYDASGRMVDDIVEGEMTAGNHSVNIDTRDLTAGIYFVRVEAPEGIGTETMTKVR